MKYFYTFDRYSGTRQLAETEGCFLSEGAVLECGVIEGKKPVHCNETGYLRGGGELICKDITIEGLRNKLRAAKLKTESFSIHMETVPKKLSGGFAAKKAVAELIDGSVNLEHPKTEFFLVCTKMGFWFGKKLPSGDDSWKRFSHKPEPFCNAAPLRPVKAILNLAAKKGDIVYDPCCGSGTIALLAHDLGTKVIASDISWAAVRRSRSNLAYFHCPVEIKKADARTTKIEADVIVCNPPYDLYCSVSDDSVVPAMLENFKSLSSKVVIITGMDIALRIKKLGYSVERMISIQRHKFERKIYFLRS